MTRLFSISTYTSRLVISLLLVSITSAAFSQPKIFKVEKDSIPVYRGIAISADLVGPAMLLLSDHGEYEGALRVNLHDEIFPVVEIGIGRANHDNDEVTGITYKTKAPYFRLGVDWNLLKNKHRPNRLYGGFRYAYTNYTVDIIRQQFPDPVWQYDSGFGVEGMGCWQHWLEGVLALDAKVAGPLHLGWAVRYKRRLFHHEGEIGRTWYVPGYGIYGNSRMSANFYIIFDI